MVRELSVEELAWRCPEEWIEWQGSDEIEPATTIVGQDRAVEAIAFGLGLDSIGYNVFVTGLSGTGRLTTIKRFLDNLADDEARPDDVCFVFNFKAPEEPCALFLEPAPGGGSGMPWTVSSGSFPRTSPESSATRTSGTSWNGRSPTSRNRRNPSSRHSRRRSKRRGFRWCRCRSGRSRSRRSCRWSMTSRWRSRSCRSLSRQARWPRTRVLGSSEEHGRLTDKLQDVFHDVSALRRSAKQRLDQTRRDLFEPTFVESINEVRSRVGDRRVDPYLTALREDLKDHAESFVEEAGEDGGDDRFDRWRVNLAVDNAELEGRPVILETEPTYTNLFGTVERSMASSGELVSSFLRIRAGSLMRANRGYLVLNAEDLLLEPRVWPGLKRALKFRRVQVQSLESMVFGAAVLKPEPVPLDVKVVVIGDRSIYDVLYRYDADFSKVFKVLADFDSVMTATEEHARDALSVLRKVGIEDDLPPMDRSAMAAMLEEAVRFGRRHRRFSSRFSDLADLQRESAHFARQDDAEFITADHVDAARRAYQRRHGLTEDRIFSLIEDGIIRVDTDGAVVGQVNGLAVYDLGHHRFGKPSRITAQVGLGREGVVNVERQAGLSGPTHDKGVSILTGFLRGTFARRIPLAMACSITFEQSYGGIDGDSASSTEVYAILSALSGLPIRQDVAVTGSVDQLGRIQAIGGVNEKVEGFFPCLPEPGTDRVPGGDDSGHQRSRPARRSGGDFGGREGLFHIWEVATVEEGIELLTGVPAGGWTAQDGWDESGVVRSLSATSGGDGEADAGGRQGPRHERRQRRRQFEQRRSAQRRA